MLPSVQGKQQENRKQGASLSLSSHDQEEADSGIEAEFMSAAAGFNTTTQKDEPEKQCGLSVAASEFVPQLYTPPMASQIVYPYPPEYYYGSAMAGPGVPAPAPQQRSRQRRKRGKRRGKGSQETGAAESSSTSEQPQAVMVTPAQPTPQQEVFSYSSALKKAQPTVAQPQSTLESTAGKVADDSKSQRPARAQARQPPAEDFPSLSFASKLKKAVPHPSVTVTPPSATQSPSKGAVSHDYHLLTLCSVPKGKKPKAGAVQLDLGAFMKQKLNSKVHLC